MKYVDTCFFITISFIFICIGSCSIYKDPVTLTYVNTGMHAGGNLTVNPEAIVTSKGSKQAASTPAEAGAIEAPLIKPIVIKPTPANKTEVIEACDRLVAPIIGQIPRLTPEQIQMISTSSSLVASQQLLDELEKIYKYASVKTQELSTAFAKQAKSCRKVTIIIP